MMKHSTVISIAFLCGSLLSFPLLIKAQAQISDQLQAGSNGAAAFSSLKPPAHPRPKRIMPLRAADVSGGSRITIAADAPLEDYQVYRSGDRFCVLVANAETAFAQFNIKGEAFAEPLVEQTERGALLSFRLQPGVSARVVKGFNRLDLVLMANRQGSKEVAADRARPIVDSADEASAKTASASDDHEAIKQMRAQVAQLEARIKDLEARESAPQPTTPPATVAAAAAPPELDRPAVPASPRQHGHTPGADHDDVPAGGPKLQLQGFADVNLRASDEKGKTTSFALGQLDLFITSRLSDKFSVLGELIVDTTDRNQFSFEIHRLLLKYAPNDYFNLSAGRYHTSIGYYNTAYHHGSWFATTANRPFIFEFESRGGPLPLHNVGLSATGRIPSGPFGLHYVAEVGNGRASRLPTDQAVQTAVDENNGKAINLGLFARPDSIPGLQTGFSVYRDHLTPAGSPDINQLIGAAYLVFHDSRYEFLNEALIVRHSSGGRVFHTPAFYTQFARQFGNFRPYFRYDYVNAPADDPNTIFQAVGRRDGPSFGLRYDLTEYAAFKAQYDRIMRRRLSTIDDLILQLAFTF